MDVIGILPPLGGAKIATPEIEYHCDRCNEWTLSASHYSRELDGRVQAFEIGYVCTKCQEPTKTFFLEAHLISREPPRYVGRALKRGEWPLFRPRVPSRIIPLLGPDLNVYQKGLLAESHGLGVAAFAYYRKVLERQRTRLLERIKRVAERQGETGAARLLEDAIAEPQFLKSLDMVRGAVPSILYIKTHNPLTLLHDLLSDGLHDENEESDERCLECVRDIRTILGELAANLDFALKQSAEIDGALSRLLARQKA